MNSRQEYARQLATLELTHIERAIAFLWYYRESQDFEDRSPSELAADLHDEGFPSPNVTRLKEGLSKSKYAVKGSRKGAFQIDVRRVDELDERYRPLLGVKEVKVAGSFLNPDLVSGTRGYLEQIVHEINGTYEYQFFDAAAVLCRRLMESLIIEVYVYEKRAAEIRSNGSFYQLERLVSQIQNDEAVVLSRNAPKNMTQIKQLGDTAAHDRVYITQKQDLDDVKPIFRRLIQELLALSGVRP